MSVFIKGMGMPKNCEECLFYEVDVENGCWLKKYFCVRRYGIDRPSWCPLVEIPESNIEVLELSVDPETAKKWWREVSEKMGDRDKAIEAWNRRVSDVNSN